mgnify:CR=1 FL=1
MRNGNRTRTIGSLTILVVLILPMRNGNPTIFYSFDSTTSRSYPTYEEWKPHFCFWYSRCSTYRSYPTYEEWKLPKTSFSFLKECSSYPTYEEWKHHSLYDILSNTTGFLSYLWGMETIFNFFFCNSFKYRSYPTYEEWKPNFSSPSFVIISVLFLSYLWGMETTYGIFLHLTLAQGSYPTYEEWKHLSKIALKYCNPPFLSYLWGMETV